MTAEMEQSPKQSPAAPLRYAIEHDGFVGTVIGQYTRLDGKRGVVMQQDGTNIVHVYGEKWLKPALPVPAAETVEPVADLIERLWPNELGPKNLDEVVTFIEEERKCDEEYRSLLSTKLENAGRENERLDRMLNSKAMTDYVLSNEVERRQIAEARAESAEQECDELRAKLAEAREAAFEEAAQILDSKLHSRPESAQHELWNTTLKIGADAIRARAVKEKK